MDYTKYTKPEIGRGCCFGEDEFGEPFAVYADGCFKLHETPWQNDYPNNVPTDIFEVRFKNTRRSFYQNVNNLPLEVGDIVAVEASPGHDVGVISLTGDMVAKQMRRIGFNPYNGEFKKIYRKAKPYDIERWQEAIALEHETMIRSRQIAAEMGLDMKIGDVEYQGDKIKAIFYYIADGRVDFRELIKVFAEQFHIRIEMKQIGARQEAGRIGGIGACGRELCCASWISSFSSVTTSAARVQDLSLNPQKLAGQCSKLKCCLMYEYDVYADARRSIPRLREPLQAMDGEYYPIKTDILARTMSFSTSKDAMANVVTIPIWRVKEILAQNRDGKKVESILGDTAPARAEEPTFRTEEDSITRFDKAKRRKKRNNNRGGRGDRQDQRSERGDKQERQGRPERQDKQERADKPERQERTDKPERTEHKERTEHNKQHGQKPERAEGTPNQGAPNQGGERQPEGERRNHQRGRNNHQRGGHRGGRNRQGGERREHKPNGGGGESSGGEQ